MHKTKKKKEKRKITTESNSMVLYFSCSKSCVKNEENYYCKDFKKTD